MADSPELMRPPGDKALRKPRVARSVIEPIRLLEGADTVTVQVEILKESYDEIFNLLKQNKLEYEEGLRTVLLAGLGYMDAQLRVDSINQAYARGDERAREHINEIVQDLATYHSMYSALKYRTFHLYKISQKLEFNVAGLRASEQMWEEWAARIRQEYGELRNEVVRLRALVSEFRVDGEPLISPPEEPEAIEPEFYEQPEGELPEPDRPDITVRPQVSRPIFLQRLRRLFGGG